MQNCYYGFIFWVLKRTVSLRWYYICFSYIQISFLRFQRYKLYSGITPFLEFVETFTKSFLSPICNHGFISWMLKRTVSLRRHFEYSQDIYWLKTFKVYILISFLRFKDISFALVSFDFWNSCKNL